MERTYIEAVERNSLFHRELQAQLRAADVQLVESPADATAVLTISIDETDQRVLSVSTRNVPTEFEVYYTVEYGLIQLGLAPPDTLRHGAVAEIWAWAATNWQVAKLKA